MAVERRAGVAARHVHDRDALVRRLGVHIHRRLHLARGQRTLLHAARYFLNRVLAAERFDVFVNELIGLRQILGRHSRHFGRRFRFRLEDHGRSDRVRRATVAGITSDFALAFKRFLVGREHHLHHLSGSDFLILVVFLERVLDVAELAFDSQGRGDELHRRYHLICRNPLQHLNVLENLLGHFRSLRWSGLRRGL